MTAISVASWQMSLRTCVCAFSKILASKQFQRRIEATVLLLEATMHGPISVGAKNLRRPAALPERTDDQSSAEEREVLQVIREGVNLTDANADQRGRRLFVAGGPGTGKTQVTLYAECTRRRLALVS